MPFVSGFLRLRKRGRPDIGLPEPEEEIDPGYGLELPEYPTTGPIPDPPPGIWPPLTPEHPWRPIPGWPERPSTGPVPPGGLPPRPGQGLPGEPPTAGQLPELPPGTIWPPLPPDVHGKFLALVLIGGMGHGYAYRYVVIDADAVPPRPEPKR